MSHTVSRSAALRRRLIQASAAIAVTTVTVAMPQARQQGNPVAPLVPASLEVPAGHRAFLVAGATGTQNYICLPSGRGSAWSFLGPQATLFDDLGQQVMTHFLSPNPLQGGAARATWQHSRDTSTVWAAAIASYTEPDYVAPGAVPWLLLEVVGAQHGPVSGARISATTYIQRVNTAGGVAPATGCHGASDVGKRVLVPYTTQYVFYQWKD
jgi:hypothetical protein